MIIPNRKPKRKAPRSAKRSVIQYAKRLRSVAAVVQKILTEGVDAQQAFDYLVKRLQGYGESLTGWALQTAANMLHEVDNRDRQQWLVRSNHLSRKQQRKMRERITSSVVPLLPNESNLVTAKPNNVISKPSKTIGLNQVIAKQGQVLSKPNQKISQSNEIIQEPNHNLGNKVNFHSMHAKHSAANSRIISTELQSEIQAAPTGELMRSLLNEQVTLIKSLPLKAAEKVHELTLAGIVNSERATNLSQKILELGDMTKNRANLIARTEVARTASLLTQARAQHIGCETYIWRTSGDSDVRQSHKDMNGQTVRWDSPPQLSDGTTTHAGQIYNCRCWAEPIIPND